MRLVDHAPKEAGCTTECRMSWAQILIMNMDVPLPRRSIKVRASENPFSLTSTPTILILEKQLSANFAYRSHYTGFNISLHRPKNLTEVNIVVSKYFKSIVHLAGSFFITMYVTTLPQVTIYYLIFSRAKQEFLKLPRSAVGRPITGSSSPAPSAHHCGQDLELARLDKRCSVRSKYPETLPTFIGLSCCKGTVYVSDSITPG